MIDLNDIGPKNENVNNILIAFAALIAVMALHDLMESTVVRSNRILGRNAVLSLLILRSHSSPSRFWKLIQGRSPVEGVYHSCNCQCAQSRQQSHLTGQEPENGIPNSCIQAKGRVSITRRRVLLIMAVLRVFIIAIEVGVALLATSRSNPVMLDNGKYAIVPFSTKVGEVVPVKYKENLGCETVFPETGMRINRQIQLTICTRLHQPIESGTKRSDVPPGFDQYLLYVDLSGDKITFADANGVKGGSEMYAYWSVEGKLKEGVVPTIEFGSSYSMKRISTLNETQLEAWRKGIDSKMRDILKEAYSSAYGTKRKWGESDGKVPLVALNINFDNLPADLMKHNKVYRVGHLLNKIISLQKFDSGENLTDIWHSDGVDIERLSGPLVEYRIVGPVLGIVPWVIITVCIAVLRVILGKVFPNNFYELNFETTIFATDAPLSKVSGIYELPAPPRIRKDKDEDPYMKSFESDITDATEGV